MKAKTPNVSETHRKELAKVHARLAELQPELEAKNLKFDDSERRYINKQLSFEDHQATHAELTLIERAVNSLLATAGNLEKQIVDAEIVEKRLGSLHRMATCAENARDASIAYTEAVKGFDQAIAKVRAAHSKLINIQDEFATEFRSIVPVEHVARPQKGLRNEYAELRNELTLYGIKEAEFVLLTNPDPETPATTNKAALVAAIRVLINEESESRLHERIARSDKVQAAAAEERLADRERRIAERKEQNHSRHAAPLSMGQ